MNLALKIAKRYFYSKKKQSFISTISMISMLGVGIGTMALVIVMSVFNGLEELNREIFKSFDADLTIKPLRGKFFEITTAQKQKIKAIEGVRSVIEVIEDNTLARYGDAQTVVSFKGVDAAFIHEKRIEKNVIEGNYHLQKDSINFAIVGLNVANMLSIRVENQFTPLVLSYPKNTGKSINLTENSIVEKGINVAAIFMLEQNHDDYIYLSLSFADSLTEANGKRTSIELMLNQNANNQAIKDKIKTILGESFSVKNQDEQNVALFRAIQIEKLIIFITLLFIIGIASFNIFFSLTMLAIDKSQDVKTMLAMGANRGLILRIFLAEGAIVGIVGAAVGLILGIGICLIQQHFGLVKMGMQTAINDNYPVKIKLTDIAISAIALLVITIGASYFPAKRAARL